MVVEETHSIPPNDMFLRALQLFCTNVLVHYQVFFMIFWTVRKVVRLRGECNN